MMDIRPSYSCLLDRPWIYEAGAVTSTQHQMLKYPVLGKIITVHGEEEYMISHHNSFRYVELDGEFIETPFQHFEEVSPEVVVAKTMTDVPIISKPVYRMAYLKYAEAVIKEGRSTVWGQLPDFPHKTDKFGLGFTVAGQKFVRHSRAGGPPVKITHHGINALEDDDEEDNFEDWIFPTVKEGLCNWEAKDFVPITFINQ